MPGRRIQRLLDCLKFRRSGEPVPVAAPQEELDPVKIASETHKLVMENQFLRVIEAKVPPGGIEPKHRHPKGVPVYLANYSIEQKTFPDGKVTRSERKFGFASS